MNFIGIPYVGFLRDSLVIPQAFLGIPQGFLRDAYRDSKQRGIHFLRDPWRHPQGIVIFSSIPWVRDFYIRIPHWSLKILYLKTVLGDPLRIHFSV